MLSRFPSGGNRAVEKPVPWSKEPAGTDTPFEAGTDPGSGGNRLHGTRFPVSLSLGREPDQARPEPEVEEDDGRS